MSCERYLCSDADGCKVVRDDHYLVTLYGKDGEVMIQRQMTNRNEAVDKELELADWAYRYFWV